MKRRRIERLAEKINNTIDNYWLFEPLGKVQGFWGTGPIMIVGERPSMGTFPDSKIKLFYRVLEQCGAADSHLTDVIKSRGKVRAPYPKDIGKHRRIFDEELKLVRPKKIIALGQKVHDLLQFSLADRKMEIIQVWHYSYTRWGKDKARLFRKKLREAIKA